MNQNGIKVRPLTVVFVLAIVVVTIFLFQTMLVSSSQELSFEERDSLSVSPIALFTPEQVWTAPDTASIPNDVQGKLIVYGRTLIIHTSKYFGPHGTVSQSSNGMNCQNCHIDAGTRPYGNNLAVK